MIFRVEVERTAVDGDLQEHSMSRTFLSSAHFVFLVVCLHVHAERLAGIHGRELALLVSPLAVVESVDDDRVLIVLAHSNVQMKGLAAVVRLKAPFFAYSRSQSPCTPARSPVQLRKRHLLLSRLPRGAGGRA